VVKVRGNAGERRSWAPKNCQLAFLGPTQANFQGERREERSSWAPKSPNNGGQRSPALHNLPIPSLWLVHCILTDCR